MSPFGAIVMSAFAAVWFAAAILRAGAPSALVLVGVAIAGVTMFAAWRALQRQAPRAPEAAARVGRIVGWASFAEGIGILLAVNAVRWAGHPDLVLPAIAVIVGLHFLPIALMVPAANLYVPGVVLTALGVGVPALMAPSAMRDLLVGIGAAVVLWGVSWQVLAARPMPAHAA